MKSLSKQKVEDAIGSLLARKTRIERSIAQEAAKRLPCSLSLRHLKKLKLGINDRVAALRLRLDQQGLRAN